MTIIRDVQITDVQSIAMLYKDAGWTEFNEFGVYTYLSHGYAKMLVAEHNGVVVGFVSVNLAEYWGRRATIVTLYIMPIKRGTTIAYRLVRELWKKLEETGWLKIFAYVRSSNQFMLNLMNRMGWNMDCTIKDYDGNGNNYFMFSRSIGEGFMRNRQNEKDVASVGKAGS